jgi:homoserine dehydrogenase
MEELNTVYYIRFYADDKPGVLAKISGVLGRNQISIASVIQKGREVDGPVPIVMLTHEAREKSVQEAMKEIHQLDELRSDKTMLIRVEKGHQGERAQ